jgi:hypothetical protein
MELREVYWRVLGVLLVGCGVRALLTAVVCLTQPKKVKIDLQKFSRLAKQIASSSGFEP